MYHYQKILVSGLVAISSIVALSNSFAESNAAQAKELAAIKTELSEPWTPPTIEKSVKASVKKRRVQAPVQYGAVNKTLDKAPDDKVFGNIDYLPEPLVPVSSMTSSMQERRALAAALRAYLGSGDAEIVEPLERFTREYPDSAWTPGLMLNLGIIAYNTGYFSKALEYWYSAWEMAKDKTDAHSVAIANRAIAEYAKMCARVGRKEELAIVFEETRDRVFQGTAKVLFGNAQEGYWSMLNKGGVAFRCGPYALTNVAAELIPGSERACSEFLEGVVSPDTGFSLSQVQAMSEELNLDLQMVKRVTGAEVVIPSVVHWKVGHYGALVREMNGKYLLKDPTFGNETWMSATAIDQESSGYFLIPAGELPKGWTEAVESEASVIYGKGHTGSGGEEETAKDDKKNGGDDCDEDLAMATYTFHTLLASLSISDTPVGYPAAYGPDVRVEVTYNQREYGQPMTINYTNFSPQWVSNWVSYLEDNPGSPGANVTLYLRGGGSEIHKDFDVSTQAYKRDVQSAAVLIKLTADTYKKVYPDGSEDYYEHFIGTAGTKRKVFLSRVTDPQGNSVHLEYDTDANYPARLRFIHDATGLSTEFFYTYPEEPCLVTRVEDPYGRSAIFSYGTVGSTVRLTDIEDVYGIVSSFAYDSSGGITALTTPYGTTTFELSDFKIGSSSDLIRYIEATDPYGDKERIEYNLSSEQTGVPNRINEPLPDSSKVAFTTGDNDDRNSFYWDKQQMKYGARDYSKAHLYHWLQPGEYDAATSILESEKPPLEGRIWYNYPGQFRSYIQGNFASPSKIGRVVENEAGTLVTEASRFDYNSLGKLTRSIDPSGRETLIDYAANDIDVVSIKQRTGGTDAAPIYSTLASYTYNPADPPHRPRTFTDSSGNTTTFSYNAYGQILDVTNELGEVTTFTYETNPASNGYGRVLSITGDVPGGNVSYTYDSFDRIRTVTNSEGYTLTYDYDVLDRVTLVTYPDSSYEQFDYENHSKVASRDREGHWTRYFHNALRQTVLEVDPLGQFTQYEWCRCGHIRKLIDGEGNITHWVRDVQGRVTEKRFADGTRHRFTYQPQSGRLETVTDALNQIATYSYFIDGNLALVDYSDSGTPDESFTYDPFYARVSAMTDGIGTTHYIYHPNDGLTDGAGYLARVDGPFADDTLKYTYDALGRLTKREVVDDATYTTPSYSEAYTFDARSRTEEVINTLGTFGYSYVGQSSRIDFIDYPNEMRTEYTYTDVTEDHLLQQIKHLNSKAIPEIISQFDYTYNQDRNIKTWTSMQNGASPKQWTFGYDAALQLTSAVRQDSTTQTVLQQLTYGYDKAGNRTSVTTDSGHTNYPANDLNQTTAEQGFGPTRFSGTLDEPALVTVNGKPAKVTSDNGNAPYTFEALVDLAEGDNTVTIEATDGNNNTTTQSYSVIANGVQKLLEYDLNGNLRFEKDSNGVILREFQWDAKNRLLAIIEGSQQSKFVYDGHDRRVRIIETEGGIVQSDQVYIWDGTQIAQRRASDGKTVQRSYYSAGFEEGANSYFYTKDHLGNIREVIASDGTTLESVYDYSPWGEVSKTGGSGAESDFLYTGHFHHEPSKLHFTLYRAYNPELGKWLSRDPIESIYGFPAEFLPEGPNLYGYVGNNPINYWDPNGLFCWSSFGKSIGKGAIIGGIAGTAGGAATGALAGGVGVGPGALAGGVGGTIAGGVAGGLNNAWDQLFGDDEKGDKCECN